MSLITFFNLYNNLRRCLAFIFAPLLRRELDEFREHWNSHTMRYNRLADCPTGATPNDLYEMPDFYGKGFMIIHDM